MSRYFQLSLLPVPIGLIIGLVAGATVFETNPPILAWVFGAGLGLMGGAFLAALASGDALVSGPKAKPGSVSDAPWLNRSAEDDD